MPGIMCTLLPRGADGKRWQILLKPANLVLVVGSAVVATGLTGAPELNGRMGKVEGWDAEAGRYVVRLEGERQLKRLKPEDCRAACSRCECMSPCDWSLQCCVVDEGHKVLSYALHHSSAGRSAVARSNHARATSFRASFTSADVKPRLKKCAAVSLSLLIIAHTR